MRASKLYQKYNKKNNAYVMIAEMPNGKSQIRNVKQKEPRKPFKGVMVKR